VALGGIDNFSTLSSPRYMSGTGYDSESPRSGATGGAGDSRSVFSFLSGFASKASTVVASNVTPYHSQQQQQQHVSNKMNVRNVTDPTSNSGPDRSMRYHQRRVVDMVVHHTHVCQVYSRFLKKIAKI
jgi:transcription initiation factor TFIID subunit TAF12